MLQNRAYTKDMSERPTMPPSQADHEALEHAKELARHGDRSEAFWATVARRAREAGLK